MLATISLLEHFPKVNYLLLGKEDFASKKNFQLPAHNIYTVFETFKKNYLKLCFDLIQIVIVFFGGGFILRKKSLHS